MSTRNVPKAALAVATLVLAFSIDVVPVLADASDQAASQGAAQQDRFQRQTPPPDQRGW
jgi:hypothetical protein